MNQFFHRAIHKIVLYFYLCVGKTLIVFKQNPILQLLSFFFKVAKSNCVFILSVHISTFSKGYNKKMHAWLWQVLMSPSFMGGWKNCRLLLPVDPRKWEKCLFFWSKSFIWLNKVHSRHGMQSILFKLNTLKH